MIYIGLDPSLTGTGMVSSSGKEEVIKTDNTQASVDRIIYIVERVKSFLRNERLKGEVVVGIEGFSFNSRGRSISQQFGLGWYLRITMRLSKFKFYEIPPSSWKKFLFKGVVPKGTGKDLILLKTYKRYNREYSNNNLCDAYNIMKFTEKMDMKISNYNFKLTKIEEDLIGKVVKANEL